MLIREFAPAKINLYLHITGRRPDGYHILDSLVAFAGVGDEIRLEKAAQFDFVVEGPQAGQLGKEPPEQNLVVRAARELARLAQKSLNLRLTLIKSLPVASGIGGGSSDAAAALRALALHWGMAPDSGLLPAAAALCGEDVSVCLKTANCYMTDRGVEAGPALPHTHIVLVNPGKALATTLVYKAFKEGGHAFSGAARFETVPADAAALAAMLKARHNELAAPALHLMPEIGAVLEALERAEGCLVARMSGSGATCFGLFSDRDGARRAASALFAVHPDWWVVQTHIPALCDRRQQF